MRTTIRVSELSLWLKCRRRAYLQYEMGWDKDNIIMGVGRVVHTMLEAYYTGREVIVEGDILSSEDYQMAENMFVTYVKEVEDEGLDVGQTTVVGEQRYHMEIDGMTLTGQIDALVEDVVRGGIIVRDHKTVGQFMDTSPRDFQLMTYAVMAREAGHDVVAIEHNQIKRNKRTTRAKPPYIRRVTHSVTGRALDAWCESLNRIVIDYGDSMHFASILGEGVESPRIWAKGTNECSWSCPFADAVCAMIDDGGDYTAVLETEYHRREEPIDITT